MCCRRALRALGVLDVADSALIARGTHELRVASTLACRLSSIRCNGRGFAVAVCYRRTLRARGISDVAVSTLITRGTRVLRGADALAYRPAFSLNGVRVPIVVALLLSRAFEATSFFFFSLPTSFSYVLTSSISLTLSL